MCAQRRFEFALAQESDDDALRALLRQISMPGNITLSFQREPSFFLAELAGSAMSQVMICTDHHVGRIVGMGSRSIRSVYIDGRPAQVGYLSMLRGLPESRGNIALARGYRYLKELHADGAIPYYFTTILDDNTEAKTLLTSARAGLPVYKPVARLLTSLLPLTRNPVRKGGSEAASRVEKDQLPEAVAFLQQWNSRYQFAPLYTEQDMLGVSQLLPGFSWENLYVYREHGKVLGTLGIWDQQSLKQTVVTAYSRQMRLIRPLYNLLARMQSKPRLPQVGEDIRILYGAFVSGNSSAFTSLLQRACAEWSGKGYDYLSLGFCEDSELSPIASRYAAQQLASTIYIVYWQDESITLPDLCKPVHVEVATL